MTKTQLHRLGTFGPPVCSALALLIVALVLFTGWERHLADEGAAAHLCQLLLLVQPPLIALFLLTARRDARRETLLIFAGQCLAFMLPVGAIAAGGL